MRSVLLVAAFMVATTLVLVPPAPAQGTSQGFKFCTAPGYEDLALVFLNPDLMPQEDGYVRASGQFFIQFQARGEKALEIETLKFSFGKPVPGAALCDLQGPHIGMLFTEGAYIKNYRSDNDWRDGFFVPINTYNVGDGEYAAAISVYDAAGTELVRAWANAIVENGGRTSGQDGCTPGSPQPPGSPPVHCPDYTKPWPMVLPGDGERMDGKSGLYIEVAEPVSDIKVYINGLPAELMETPAPARDDDVVPDLGYGPLYKSPQAEGQLRNRVWGPAWNWDGAIKIEDVVKVVVTDAWGNVAEKVVHIGDPTIGGRVSGGNPEFEIILDEDQKETNENGRAVFNVTYRITKDFLHGNVFVRNPNDETGKMPEGVTVKITPNHVMEGAGKDVLGTVTFVAGPTAALRTHDLRLAVEYLVGQEHVSKEVPLKLTVAARGNGTADDPFASKFGTTPEQIRGTQTQANATEEEVAPEEDAGFLGLPAPGVVLAALAGLGAALAARRRR